MGSVASTSGHSASTAKGPACVLVVEDNADAAESMMMLLELLGHTVHIAHDGLSALDQARAQPPDIMLVDIGLPGIDGYEVARRVRRDPQLCHLMMVALTGYGCDDDKRAAVAAGFDQHLVKPVDPDVLQQLIATFSRNSPGDCGDSSLS